MQRFESCRAPGVRCNWFRDSHAWTGNHVAVKNYFKTSLVIQQVNEIFRNKITDLLCFRHKGWNAAFFQKLVLIACAMKKSVSYC